MTRAWHEARRKLAAAVVILAAVSGCGGSHERTTSTTAALAGSRLVCGARPQPSGWRHVVWIWLENHSYGEVLGPPGSSADRSMPFLNSLARSCGVANAYYAIAHPSLPNYIGAVSGETQGIETDCPPTRCPLEAPSLFDQLGLAHLSWRVYAEGMTTACQASASGLYVPTHNPVVYFPRLGGVCKRSDVPLRDTSLVKLPSFTIVVPNLCNDAHSCGVSLGDAWLRSWIPKLTGSRYYRRGRTVIFVTWDEGSGGNDGEVCAKFAGSCHVATVVVSPSTTRGSYSEAYFTHYSLLKTTEQLLRLPLLGHARDRGTASMRTAFGL